MLNKNKKNRKKKKGKIKEKLKQQYDSGKQFKNFLQQIPSIIFDNAII